MSKKNGIEKINNGIETIPLIEYVKWEIDELNVFENINETLKFEKTNLIKEIIFIVNIYHSIKNVINHNPGLKEQYDYVSELKNTITKLFELLSDEKMGKVIKNKLGNTIVLLTRNLITTPLKNLHNACVTTMNFIMYEFNNKNKTSPNNIPKRSDSENKKTLKRTMLNLLYESFEKNSSLKPTIYTTSHSDDNYDGTIYQFCIALSPILKSKFNIDIGTNQTIGTYLKEIRTEKLHKT
jgi:hypothetical protein